MRFNSKVKRADGGCWEWVGKRFNTNYGRFSINHTKTVRAHRYAWERANGPIPEGMMICHRCDNPPCVNPAHLFLGTGSDNQQDRVSKLRGFFGEQHHKSKLTEDAVRAIRLRYAAGETNKAALARAYGVTGTMVRWVIERRFWKQVA